MITIDDDHSRYTWTYMIASKIQVSSVLLYFFTMIKTQFQKAIKKIRADNGIEFLNRKCYELFLEKGIIHKKIICIQPPTERYCKKKAHTSLTSCKINHVSNKPS